MRRGEIWWANLPEPRGSEPAGRRPILIVQSDDAGAVGIRTTIAVTLTANLRWKHAPGCVLLPAPATGLPRDSVANVYQLATIDVGDLTEKVGRLAARYVRNVEGGLRRVLEM